MRIDALAFEPHFLDHLAPVWAALAPEERGAFTVDVSLAARARAAGIEPATIDGRTVRALSRHPAPNPGDGPTALVASYGDIKVGRRLGYRRFAFLEHGAGQSYGGDRRHRRHGSYAGGEDREDVGLFLVPGEGPAERWRAAYPDAHVMVVGCPKLDTLPRRDESPGPVVAIGFHWDCHLVPETRSAFGHYLPVLPELARSFTVIGHGHPRAADWLSKAYRRARIEWVPDFAEVCRRADVYVCDNSSSMFEFAATDRPVVVLNAPWYRREIDHGLRFWEAASVGLQVDRPAALVETIGTTLMASHARELKRRRDDALRLVYGYRSGGAARAADAIRSWLRVPAVVR